MTYTGVYAVVLVLHLLAAIFLIGPLGLAGTLSASWVKKGDVGGLRTGHRTTQLYSLLSLLVPLLGVALTMLKLHGSKPWSLSQAWVGASLALYVVAVGVNLLVIGPAQKKAITALELPQPGEVVAPDPSQPSQPPAEAPETAAETTQLTEPEPPKEHREHKARRAPASLDLLQGRLQAASGVQMLCWLVVVILMVTKPGA